MVKWTSSRASNAVFRVRVLVGLRIDTEGLPDWRREPVRNRPNDKPCGFNSRFFRLPADVARPRKAPVL